MQRLFRAVCVNHARSNPILFSLLELQMEFVVYEVICL